MTTIAWDGKTLAADRQCNAGGIRDLKVTKILKRKDGAICGAAGRASEMGGFHRWFLAGEKKSSPKLSEKSAAFIVRPSGKLVIFDEDGWFEADPGPYAIGTGWEIARATMFLGFNAVKAVETAAALDSNTNNEVDTLELGK